MSQQEVSDHSGAEGEEGERVWGGCVGRVMCPLTPGVCWAISRLFPFTDYIVRSRPWPLIDGAWKLNDAIWGIQGWATPVSFG